MRYQKLESQEALWKWKYLLKKYREGENITKYDEQSLADLKVDLLTNLQHSPEEIEQWIKAETTPEQRRKLRQSIRARRKRFFNAERQSTRKKSIDLTYQSWQRLAKLAAASEMTLSETIMYLLDEYENKQMYVAQMETMKEKLKLLIRS